MATKVSSTEEAISMTEKKLNMSLDDIIKMSKKNAAKGKRPPRPPAKKQGFQNSNPSHGNAKLQGFMDSRSSIRQGVLGKRRSNSHGNQFPAITEEGRKAAVQKRMINQIDRMPMTLTPLQRSADDDSNSEWAQTLDAIFANMYAMKTDFVIEKIEPDGSMQVVQRPFGSRQQQRRGAPGGGVRLVQRPFGLRQQQGRGGRGPRGGVQLGQSHFGSGQRQ